jgi:hypothetical protein
MHVHLSSNLNLDKSHFLGLLLHSRHVRAMDSVPKLVSNLVIRDQLDFGGVRSPPVPSNPAANGPFIFGIKHKCLIGFSKSTSCLVQLVLLHP